MIIIPINISGWDKKGGHHNWRLIYRSWHVLWIVIVIYCFYNYLKFFASYINIYNVVQVVRNWVGQWVDIIGVSKIFALSGKIDSDNYILINLWDSYYNEILLLFLGLITKMSLTNQIKRYEVDSDPESKHVLRIFFRKKLYAEHQQKQALTNAIGQVMGLAPKRDEPILPGLDCGLDDGHNTSHFYQGIFETGLESKTEQMFIDKIKNICSDNKIRSVTSLMNESDMIGSMKDKRGHITFKLLYKGFQMISIIWLLTENVNLMKCLYLAWMLFNNVGLFTRLGKCFTDLRFGEVLALCMEYFEVSFVKLKRIVHKENYGYDEDTEKRDFSLRHMYLDQMVKKFEVNLMFFDFNKQQNTLYFIMSYMLFVMFGWEWYRVFYETSPEEQHVEFRGEMWLNILIGIKNLHFQPFKYELIRTHMILFLLILEFILDTYINNCKKEKPWENNRITILTNLIIKKFKFYIARKNPEITQEYLEQAADEIAKTDEVLKGIEDQKRILAQLDETESDISNEASVSKEESGHTFDKFNSQDDITEMGDDLLLQDSIHYLTENTSSQT
jgi:hypothetical protein